MLYSTPDTLGEIPDDHKARLDVEVQARNAAIKKIISEGTGSRSPQEIRDDVLENMIESDRLIVENLGITKTMVTDLARPKDAKVFKLLHEDVQLKLADRIAIVQKLGGLNSRAFLSGFDFHIHETITSDSYPGTPTEKYFALHGLSSIYGRIGVGACFDPIMYVAAEQANQEEGRDLVENFTTIPALLLPVYDLTHPTI